MLIDIDKIVVGDRIRKDFGDIQELADDIKENGLINPPVVNKDYVLLAGERRLRACKLLGWPQIEVRMMDTRDAEHELRIEITENELRKEFTWSERLEYARQLERIESVKAQERITLGVNNPQGSETGKTREKVAHALGIGDKTLRQARVISDNRDLLDPAEFAEWDEGKLSTNKAYQRIKEAKARAERERDAARQELDAVQQDLADAWQAQEDAETEAVMLKRKLESIEKPKPEVVERKVEVSSESDRRRIAELEHERDLYLDNVQKLRKRNEDMCDELDKAKEILGMDKTLHDVRRDVQYLITATNSYVRRYGGLTWTVQQLGDVDEPTLEQLRKAVRNLATFSNALMTSLENTNE